MFSNLPVCAVLDTREYLGGEKSVEKGQIFSSTVLEQL